MAGDRQLQLIVAIWALALVNALWSGAAMPTSELVAFAPQRFDYLFPSIALLGPPVLMAANHVFAAKWRWSSINFGRLQRAVDSRFGDGTTIRFWRRLRPISLISAGAFLSGVVGFIASTIQNAPPASFEHSLTSVCFGVGFLLALVLERHVFKDPHAA